MPAAALERMGGDVRMVLDRVLRAAPEGAVRVHVVDHVDLDVRLWPARWSADG